MVSKLSLVISCCCSFFVVASIYSAPLEAPVERTRVSRDLDKVDGLRARLLKLQKDLNALEEPTTQPESVKPFEGGREQGSRVSNDVSADLHATARTEAQMTSQQRVQKLAMNLDDGRNKDLHTLAQTLNQLLHQTAIEEARRHPDTAGEYLGDNYKGPVPMGTLTNASGNDDDKRGGVAVEDTGMDSSRITNIYNMLLKMYRQQLASDAGEAEEESQLEETRSLPQRGSRTRIPAVHVDEGSFGDFVDDRDETPSPRVRPTQIINNAIDAREAILGAIESRLLTDVQDARDVGVSVEDIIKDIQIKAQHLKQEKLHEIEQELDELTERNL